MRHVSVAELKVNAEELIAAAEAGEEIVVAGQRHPVRLVPTVQIATADDEIAVARRRAALDDLAKLRGEMREWGVMVNSDEWISWKNEGRR